MFHSVNSIDELGVPSCEYICTKFDSIFTNKIEIVATTIVRIVILFCNIALS